MRNFIDIDFEDLDLNGAANSDYSTNELYLTIKPASMQKNDYKVEITDVSGSVHTSSVLELGNGFEEDMIDYLVDVSYYNGDGTMKVRLLSNEGNSSYVSFSCVAFEDGSDVTCSLSGESFKFSLSDKEDYEMHILTLRNNQAKFSCPATTPIQLESILIRHGNFFEPYKYDGSSAYNAILVKNPENVSGYARFNVKVELCGASLSKQLLLKRDRAGTINIIGIARNSGDNINIWLDCYAAVKQGDVFFATLNTDSTINLGTGGGLRTAIEATKY